MTERRTVSRYVNGTQFENETVYGMGTFPVKNEKGKGLDLQSEPPCIKLC